MVLIVPAKRNSANKTIFAVDSVIRAECTAQGLDSCELHGTKAMYLKEQLFQECGNESTLQTGLPLLKSKSEKSDSQETVTVKCGLCDFAFERSKFPAKHALVCPSCGVKFEHTFNEPKPNPPTNIGEYIFFHTAAHSDLHAPHFLKSEQHYHGFLADIQPDIQASIQVDTQKQTVSEKEKPAVSYLDANNSPPNEYYLDQDSKHYFDHHDEHHFEPRDSSFRFVTHEEQENQSLKSAYSANSSASAEPFCDVPACGKKSDSDNVTLSSVTSSSSSKEQKSQNAIWETICRSNYYSITITLLQSAAIVMIVIGLLNFFSTPTEKIVKNGASSAKQKNETSSTAKIKATAKEKVISSGFGSENITSSDLFNLGLPNINAADLATSAPVTVKLSEEAHSVLTNFNNNARLVSNTASNNTAISNTATNNAVTNNTVSSTHLNKESTPDKTGEVRTVNAGSQLNDFRNNENDYDSATGQSNTQDASTIKNAAVTENASASGIAGNESFHLQTKLIETEKKVNELEKMYQQTLKQQQGQIQNQSRRLVTETLLRESALILNKRPSQSLLMTLQAIRMFQELGQQVPELAKTILSDSLSKQTSGDTLLNQPYTIISMNVSPNGKWLMTSHADRSVWIWDISSIGLHGVPDTGYCVDIPAVPVKQLVMSSDERWLIGGRTDGVVQIWNMTLDNPSTLPILLQDVVPGLENLQISPDDHWLVAHGNTSNANSDNVNGSGVNGGGVNGGAASGGAASGGGNSSGIWLWDIHKVGQQGNTLRSVVLRGHEGQVKCMSISPDSRWLASGGEDRTARIYDLKSHIPGGNQKVLRGHLLEITDIKFSGASNWVVTGSQDNTVRIWDMKTESVTPGSVVLKGHDGWISSVAVTNDGKWLATAGYDRTIRLWNVPSMLSSNNKQESLVLSPLKGFSQRIEFSPDGNSLISHGNDRSIQIWDMTSDAIAEHSISLQNEVSSFMIGEKGRWLVMANKNEEVNSVQLWPLGFDDMVSFAARFSQATLTNEECEQAEMYARQLEQKLR